MGTKDNQLIGSGTKGEIKREKRNGRKIERFLYREGKKHGRIGERHVKTKGKQGRGEKKIGFSVSLGGRGGTERLR